MLAPIILSLFAASSPIPAPAPAKPASTEPPVKVWLSDKGDYFFGQSAKVYAKSAENGYLVVLLADTRGRVRVLFPLDPNGDQSLKAGKKVEIKGRGNREAFVVGDSGHGIVFAAFSKSRFDLEKFVQRGHWDYRALDDYLRDNADRDPEAGLMDMVEQMQPAEHYNYDVANYEVIDPRYNRYGHGRGWGPYGPGPRVAVGFGLVRPFWGRGYYGGFYDPFYAPFGFGPRWWW